MVAQAAVVAAAVKAVVIISDQRRSTDLSSQVTMYATLLKNNAERIYSIYCYYYYYYDYSVCVCVHSDNALCELFW